MNEEGNPNAGGYWAIDNDRDDIYEKKAPENLANASNLNMTNNIFILIEELWWVWLILSSISFLYLLYKRYRILNHPFIRITRDLLIYDYDDWILNWSEILKIEILEKKRDVILNILFKRKNKLEKYKASIRELANLEDLFETLKLRAEEFGFDIEQIQS
ncbi:MAG: hypothetical protein ACE5K0_05535 [Candidatus Methanofastidiosia archaeon]